MKKQVDHISRAVWCLANVKGWGLYQIRDYTGIGGQRLLDHLKLGRLQWEEANWREIVNKNCGRECK